MNRFALPRLMLLTPFLLGCDLGGRTEATPAQEPVVRPVIAETAKPLQTDYLQMVGIIAPRNTTQMGFTVMGRLMSRDVEVGDLVTKGDALARIDATGLELAVDAALADLRTAEAQLENARGVLTRQSALHESSLISDSSFELARLQHRTAQARLESASANLAAARDQLNDAVLFAGFDGLVTAVGGEVGEIVALGLPVVTLARPEARDAIIDIPEVLVPSIALGDDWNILLELAPDIQAAGTIREISPQGDSSTRTHRVRIALTNAPAAFRLGTTVFARPADATMQPLFSLPATALVRSNNGERLWVVDPDTGRVDLRAVEMTFAPGGRVLISTGLAEGDIVVTAGAASLTEGQIVRLDEDLKP